MHKKKYVAVFVMLVLLCSCLSGCLKMDVLDPEEATSNKEPGQTIPTTETNNTDSSENTTQPTEAEDVDSTEQEETVLKTPVDIDTVGGAVIVGVIGYDGQGWYLQPEQPLNVTYEYFLDNPSLFPEQTRIAMFDPAVDGVEKTRYLGQTVTMDSRIST